MGIPAVVVMVRSSVHAAAGIMGYGCQVAVCLPDYGPLIHQSGNRGTLWRESCIDSDHGLWKRSARGGQSDKSDYLLVDRQGKVYSQAELRPHALTALPHGHHTAGTPRQRGQGIVCGLSFALQKCALDLIKS